MESFRRQKSLKQYSNQSLWLGQNEPIAFRKVNYQTSSLMPNVTNLSAVGITILRSYR